MSVEKSSTQDSSKRFLLLYFFWLLILFAIFYWGSYWSASKLGYYIDYYQRDFIMQILDSLLDNKIVNYDIIINPKYHVVITPECNGLVPYFIFLAGVLAYRCNFFKKLLWLLGGYIIFSLINLIRLYAVVEIVNRFGGKYFFIAHDIGGNLLLVATGAICFLIYLKSCKNEI